MAKMEQDEGFFSLFRFIGFTQTQTFFKPIFRTQFIILFD